MSCSYDECFPSLVHIAITIIPRWKVVRQTKAISRASLSMLVRICVFSIYGIITLAYAFLDLTRLLFPDTHISPF